jgi:uncharacterized DUF497 family protein
MTRLVNKPQKIDLFGVSLKTHGLDFVDAPRVFEGATYTFEDDRFSYGEQRFVTLGLLAGMPVCAFHTERDHEI